MDDLALAQSVSGAAIVAKAYQNYEIESRVGLADASPVQPMPVGLSVRRQVSGSLRTASPRRPRCGCVPGPDLDKDGIGISPLLRRGLYVCGGPLLPWIE